MSVLTDTKPASQKAAQEDFLPLNGTDYVEFYVSNSKQAAHFYKTAFGFQSFAYKGLETGNKAKHDGFTASCGDQNLLMGYINSHFFIILHQFTAITFITSAMTILKYFNVCVTDSI